MTDKKTKTIAQKVAAELKSVVLVTLYFAVWLTLLIVLKKLILKNYNIEFVGLSTALLGALIMGKVVLIMEYIELGKWVKKQPAIVDVLLRTLLYTLGVIVVLLLEKAFEARKEEGGFGAAISKIFENRDIYKVWASTIVISFSLFWYNVFSILTQYLKTNEIATLFLKTPLEKVLEKHPDVKTIDL